MVDQTLTDTRFSELDLEPRILEGLASAGFEFCTPIQAATLPTALRGHDVAGQAQTGTGKTAAFLLAVFHRLLTTPERDGRRPNQPRTLILAPTRELAMQIHTDAVTLGGDKLFRLALAYGGTGYEEQRERIKAGADILIGTPGRIIDFFKQHVFDLNAADVVVLDEADRMFDLGFIKDIRYLLRRCPPPEQRQGLLFSATLSYRVTELAYEHMNHPEQVKVESEQITAAKVREVLYHVANDEKIPLLIGLLRRIDPHRTIIFINTKRDADRVRAYLEGNGYHSAILSGDVPQQKRQTLLRKFQAGELPILVATDVAARGLHIPDVSHVINYDLPQDAEDYVHRIGRTARLGAEGDAISFACERFVYALPEIEDFIGHKIPSEAVDEALLVTPQPPAKIERHSRPGGSGPRRGGPPRGGRSGGGRPGGGGRRRPQSA